MDVKKILWPTDLSGRARHALAYVRSLTEKYGAEIHVLYVITDVAHHRGLYGNFEQEHIDRIYAWEKQKAGERLEQICSQELEGCPLYIKHVAVGDPAQEIIKTTLEEEIDMVVLASRGAGGYFQIGAVAEKIIKYSPVPVVMVPTRGEPKEMTMAS
ncbi:MAG TPA: universal stress protein [Desulfosarcina sp.]|nr:universal stress protein [Desulfosarcina sp.]